MVLPRPARSSPHDRWTRRLIGLIVAALGAAPLAIAAGLTPSIGGVGTHQQLGLPPCRFLETSGIPCPTCGMTTAFAWAADGQLLQALKVQPMGALMALALACLTLIGLWGLVTASPVARLLTPLLRLSVIIAAILLGLIAWVYAIASHQGLFG